LDDTIREYVKISQIKNAFLSLYVIFVTKSVGGYCLYTPTNPIADYINALIAERLLLKDNSLQIRLNSSTILSRKL